MNTLRISTPLISLDLSPFYLKSGDYDLARALFSPWFLYDGNIKPYLIEKYSANENFTIFRFEIKKNLYFHNKREVNSQDFKFSLQRGMLFNARNSFKNILLCIEGSYQIDDFTDIYKDCVSGIKLINNYTFDIILKYPCSHFPIYFTRSALSIVPYEALDDDKPWLWKKYPIGTGAFQVIENINNKVQLELIKFPLHFSTNSSLFQKIIFSQPNSEFKADITLDQEYSYYPNFLHVESKFSMIIALEHFHHTGPTEYFLFLRKLINSALDKNIFIKYYIENSNLSAIETNQFLPTSIKKYNFIKKMDDFNSLYIEFLEKFEKIPFINIVVYNLYGKESIIYKLQILLFETLQNFNLPVQIKYCDSLDFDLNPIQHYVILASSSFNYPVQDNLSLFFSNTNEIFRYEDSDLLNLKKIIKQAGIENNLDKKEELYLKFHENLINLGLIYPLFETFEYACINTSIMDPKKIFYHGYHPYYEFM
ncbi:hypothetical protein GCL60_02205 [Silvanigrella paludirubra]|uniref:Solute-binding protein family 5 domain-containing protein n=1 Tax=Silvanigrella paludirubra TaxID=2499159 RepID=A0A6N6VZQ4_9BACT|nr:ABC transporter substrate-binding protein [Silvanigrella paludirubra]KAB8040762.1 hypothetical protein GCL60_02205 [Silvanigrella paludirubra]